MPHHVTQVNGYTLTDDPARFDMARGLGKAIIAWMQSHPELQGFRRMHLATRDAHGLYAQFGFVPLTGADRLMEIRGPGYQ